MIYSPQRRAHVLEACSEVAVGPRAAESLAPRRRGSVSHSAALRHWAPSPRSDWAVWGRPCARAGLKFETCWSDPSTDPSPGKYFGNQGHNSCTICSVFPAKRVAGTVPACHPPEGVWLWRVPSRRARPPGSPGGRAQLLPTELNRAALPAVCAESLSKSRWGDRWGRGCQHASPFHFTCTTSAPRLP